MITLQKAQELTTQALEARAEANRLAAERLAEQGRQQRLADLSRYVEEADRRITNAARQGQTECYVGIKENLAGDFQRAIQAAGFNIIRGRENWTEVDMDGDTRHRSNPAFLISWTK